MSVPDKINRLRDLADWLEANPLPEDVNVIVGQGPSLALFTQSHEGLRAARRAVGKVDKQTDGSGSLLLVGDVGGIKAKIWPPAGTCKRVRVGTEIRTREEPVETRTVTESVPVYEWKCGPVLSDEPAEDVA